MEKIRTIEIGYDTKDNTIIVKTIYDCTGEVKTSSIKANKGLRDLAKILRQDGAWALNEALACLVSNYLEEEEEDW